MLLSGGERVSVGYPRRFVVMIVALVLGCAVVVPVGAQGEEAARVEVRVWQHVEDERDVYISARPAGGSWRTLGTIPLPLDDGHSPSRLLKNGPRT